MMIWQQCHQEAGDADVLNMHFIIRICIFDWMAKLKYLTTPDTYMSIGLTATPVYGFVRKA